MKHEAAFMRSPNTAHAALNATHQQTWSMVEYLDRRNRWSGLAGAGMALHKNDSRELARDRLGVAIVGDMVGLTSHDYVRRGNFSRCPDHLPHQILTTMGAYRRRFNN